MREDDLAAYLSTVPENFCRADCALPGTDVRSGTELQATCQAEGDRTTNGQDDNPIDDVNPGLFESTRWYGIQLPDGRFGYISEVWIRDADRGGLELPHC
jgi:hypothetical protein